MIYNYKSGETLISEFRDGISLLVSVSTAVLSFPTTAGSSPNVGDGEQPSAVKKTVLKTIFVCFNFVH